LKKEFVVTVIEDRIFSTYFDRRRRW